MCMCICRYQISVKEMLYGSTLLVASERSMLHAYCGLRLYTKHTETLSFLKAFQHWGPGSSVVVTCFTYLVDSMCGWVPVMLVVY